MCSVILFPLLFLCTLLNVCLGTHYQEPILEDEPLQQQCCASSSPLVGTLTPTFLPLDKYGKIDYDMIPMYINFLSNNGIHGIILFSVETAALELTQEEKKKLISFIAKETKRLGLTFVVQAGETSINDTISLVRYAKKAGVDGILSRPEFYYAAPTVKGVVEYLQYIAKAAYPTKFLYSDQELGCSLDYNTVRIVRALRATVKNFAGYKTTFIRALQSTAVLGHLTDISVLSSDSSIVGPAYGFCLNGTSTIIANIFPKYVVRVQQAALTGNADTAIAITKKINRVYYGCITIIEYDIVDRTLLGYRIQIGTLLVWIVNGIDLGNAASPPLPILTLEQQLQCYYICQREGVAKKDPRDRPGYIKNNDNDGLEYVNPDKIYPDSVHEYPGSSEKHPNSSYDNDNDDVE